MSEARRRKLRARLREFPDFWARVIEECRRRDSWARERRFPTLDQILEPRLLARLLEGNYRECEVPKVDFQAMAEDLHRRMST